ncbi:hypothetical protein HY251_08455 [bacterium]|nr:hypothetical protein [bacterium]
MSDYLHDKTGKDEEVEKLEHLLRPLAWKPGKFAPSEAPAQPASARPARAPLGPFLIAGLLATAAVAAGAFAFFRPTASVSPEKSPGTPFVPPTEEPKERVLAGSDSYRLESGESIRTAERVTLVLGGRIGTLIAEKDVRLRVLALTDSLQKVRLEEGTVHARIGANVHPGLFQVETPASTCVDLGCYYTLEVDRSGRSTVRVESGRVAFVDAGGHEVFVPKGAHCRAVPSRGSGTPLFDDSSDDLAAAIEGFDQAPSKERAALARGVADRATRAKDTLSLWHFLQDPDAAVVEIGCDALARLAPLAEVPPFPDGVTREETLAHPKGVFQKWKEHLWPIWEE